VNYGLIYIGNL